MEDHANAGDAVRARLGHLFPQHVLVVSKNVDGEALMDQLATARPGAIVEASAEDFYVVGPRR